MNHIKKFEKNLRLFHNATNIPICVFNNMQRDLLRCPRIASMDCSLETMKRCSRSIKKNTASRRLPIMIFSGSCFLALLKLDNDINVMFGPVSSTALLYKEFLLANKNYSDADDLLHLYRITQQGPHISPEQFANNLSLYIRLAFQEEIPADEILKKPIHLNNSHTISEEEIAQASNYITGTKAIELVNQLLFYIKNGHISELEKITDNMPLFSIRSPFPFSIEEMKADYYRYATLCLKAVIDKGLHIQSAVTIFDIYTSQITSLTSPQSFVFMYSQLSIDYCRQMVEIGQHTNSHIVNRCLQYIERHIHDKITIDDLARYCNLSKRTITRHFSEYFHMPAAEYILQLKLKTAAYLLTNSTFSVVEISNQLSFSSQSHFSVAFKKQYHYTPQQYRLYFKVAPSSSPD